jgi:hypothetical protein
MSGKLVRCAACSAELGTKMDSIVTLYADQYPSLTNSFRTTYDDEADQRLIMAPCPVCGVNNQWGGAGVRLRTR